MRARQLDETIAQILPLQKNEDDEYCGDAGGRERPQQGRNQRRDILQRRGRRLPDLDRYGLGFLSWCGNLRLSGRIGNGLLGLIDFFAKVLKDVRGTFEGSARRGRTAQPSSARAHWPRRLAARRRAD
jgi:hypothetical protein